MLVTQFIGFVAMGLNFVTRALTNDRQLKIVGVIAASTWALHFGLLHAWVGASTNLIEVLVIFASLWVLPPFMQWVFIALPLLPAPWIVSGLVDVLPLAAGVLLGFAMMFLKDIPLRLALLATSVMWLVYNAVSFSWGGVVTEVISLGILVVTIYRMGLEVVRAPAK